MINKIKKALNTRFYFDNWFSLLVGYTLNRVGFNVKLKAKINDCIFKIDPGVFARFVSRASRGLIKSIRCYDDKLLINGIQVNDITDVIYNTETWAKVLGWIYDESCKCWVKENVKFLHMYEPIHEVFEFGEYSFIDVKERIVVDIGAFVGDSTIYFAVKGAKRIIAIEPHPKAFEELVSNIKLNGLETIVIPINAAVASKAGEICIEENIDVRTTGGKYYRITDLRRNNCVSIPAITLENIIEKYVAPYNEALVLKMDCEGCEYDVILNDYEHIRVFDAIIFEYHAYITGIPLKMLLKKLSKDYECKIVSDKKFYERHGYSRKLLGLVECIKRK
jgi:FkbM family methyltransferase